VLDLPRATYYDSLTRPLSARSRVDAALTVAVTEAHTASRGTYGAPRVHAELRLGLGNCCGRKRIARLMTAAGLVGVSHQRKRPSNRPLPGPHDRVTEPARVVALVGWDRRASS